MVNNTDYKVRVIVAEKEYGLDILINDENWLIRAAVASKNYGLDKLINDSNPSVRLTAFDEATSTNSINNP